MKIYKMFNEIQATNHKLKLLPWQDVRIYSYDITEPLKIRK